MKLKLGFYMNTKIPLVLRSIMMTLIMWNGLIMVNTINDLYDITHFYKGLELFLNYVTK